MTPDHQNTPSAPAAFRLTVLQGPDRGKKFDLAPDREYLIGRAEECDIRIDVSDKTVSRRHARLKITRRHIHIENLSATNPVTVKGKPIEKADVSDKDEFRVGESLFTVERIGASPAPGRGIPPLRPLMIGALVLMVGFLGFVIFSGGEKDSPQAPAPASEALPPARHFPVDFTENNQFQGTGIAVSAEDMKKADQHFRQGMFFHDTGNLAKSVEEWNRAVILNPDHPDAQTWLMRAERELEEIIKTHYQNAMLHYKYMRYNDAAHEFRQVVELSLDKTSDQYVNASKLLNEIENRQ